MNDPTFILTKATTTSTTVSTPVEKLPPELSFGKNQLVSNADDMSSVEMASQPSANGKQADDDECIFLTETQPNADNDDNDDGLAHFIFSSLTRLFCHRYGWMKFIFERYFFNRYF